jgi:hypothetical protein
METSSQLLKISTQKPGSGSIGELGVSTVANQWSLIRVPVNAFGSSRIFRLILPLLPKASLNYTYIIYVIGVITISSYFLSFAMPFPIHHYYDRKS